MKRKEILNLMVSAVYDAAELIIKAHGIIAENKTDARNVVTEYDVKVQRKLIDTLSAKIPGAHFFCEEMEDPDSLDAEHIFIIDPIDGTMNFVHGFNHSCISVAYSNCGELCAAAVYNPYVKEMFTALKGEGAFLNGKKISCGNTRLSETLVLFGTSPYAPSKTEETFRMVRAVFDKALDVRRQGSAELDLCSVAAGRSSLYFELQVSLWDYAAGALLVSEAGGKCCTITGCHLPFDESKSSIVAGSSASVDEFLELIRADVQH